MKIVAFAAVPLLVALGACATAEPTPEPSYYVMRHLHKAADPQDPGLTVQGQNCAGRLATQLAGAGIGTILASTTRRARETAEPLAEAIGVVATPYDPRDTAGLVAQARSASGSVLVVGHSNTVPEIVEGLGGTRPGPIDESRYAELWRVARSGGGTTMTPIPGC